MSQTHIPRGLRVRWTEQGDRIIGLTPTGRATVVTLNLNRPALVKARQLWVTVGWHPPKNDSPTRALI
jgi:hypothetical protein